MNPAAERVAFVRRISFRTIAVGIFFVALWFMLFRQLSGEWSANDQYSYGWFVPFFALLLFWLRWEDAPKRAASSQAQGPGGGVALIIIAGALIMLFPIRVFEIANPDWRPLSWLHAICVVAVTLVFLWSVGGRPWLKHFAFPVLFTLIAVPWITPIEAPIVQGLMRVVATIASEAVALFGIPTQIQGTLIRVPNGIVGVNEACSGVRSLQTSLMIGLLFGELKRLPIASRIALVAAAVAIAFVGNCARAFFLVWPDTESLFSFSLDRSGLRCCWAVRKEQGKRKKEKVQHPPS
jgi:exosortase